MESKKIRPARPPSPTSRTDAARIQSVEAKANGGVVRKNSFAARATRAAAKNHKA
jgi:hypothetical protein